MSKTLLEEPAVSVELAGKLGLSAEEFEGIKEILSRTPNYTELSIFSVMWSEHCSYKNSIRWLKTLPKAGKHILAEAGEENAGLVDIGEGLACAFKIESHNHPSAIEPYQGAATGVGGIHRDIFTMGARPIAALNSLRFGNIRLDRTKWLVKGVVKGIGDYGNCFGVPTVGGEVYFDDCYNVNPLVNAMSVGIVEIGKTVSATAHGVGNPIYIVGSATGKDGIHGATFASENIEEDASERLPAVQVGDPFQEKLLLEATLEAIKADCVIGMQDMGAAGITCSTCEMSEKGKHGMRIYLDKVPCRQPDMQPYEILLSESQERMLVVVEKGKEKEIEQIFDKWDLNCVIIGEVTDTKRVEYFMHGELVAEVPAQALVLGGGVPVYERAYKEPAYVKLVLNNYNIDKISEPKDLKQVAQFLAAHPNIASRKWIYEQYDSMVQINNKSTNAPSDAAIVRIESSKFKVQSSKFKVQSAWRKNTDRALAITVDCNAHYIYADPHKGAMIAVAEAARNIVCSGGKPVAITNCLNFGNPYNQEVYWQFVGAIKGMGEACRKFGTPVTGGNVSFYNQSSDEGPVFPTPVMGMLGVIDDVSKVMSLAFKQAGDLIYLLGEPQNDISSSQYLIHYHKIKKSPAPYFDLEKEYALQQVVKKLIQEQLILSAHDISEGGLFITLLESAMWNELGFEIRTDSHYRKDAYLFGEAQSRVVVSVKKQEQQKFEQFLLQNNISLTLLGETKKEEILIDKQDWGSIQDFKSLYDNSLENELD